MPKGMNLIILAGLILALILNSLFVIDEKEDGIVFQFGEAIRSVSYTHLRAHETS